MVRVRYEEERNYYAAVKKVRGFAQPSYIDIPEIESAIANKERFGHRCLFDGGGVVVKKCTSIEEAREIAKTYQEGHREHLRNSQLYR